MAVRLPENARLRRTYTDDAALNIAHLIDIITALGLRHGQSAFVNTHELAARLHQRGVRAPLDTGTEVGVGK